MKTKNPYWICAAVGVAMLVKTILSALTGYIAFPLFREAGINLGDSIWATLGANTLVLYAIALPVFLIMMHFIPDGPPDSPAAKRYGPGLIIVAFVICVGGGALVNLITSPIVKAVESLFSDEVSSGVAASLAEIPGRYPALAIFLLAACVAGFFEEFIYRYMLRKKMRGCSDLSYILLSALFFSLMHTNISQFAAAFFLGALLAWVYVQTNNFWVVAGIHTAIDTVSLVIMPALPEGMVQRVMIVYLAVTALAAVVLTIIFFKRFKNSLRPATVPGWSWKPLLQLNGEPDGPGKQLPQPVGEPGRSGKSFRNSAFFTCVLNPGTLLFIIGALVITFAGWK